MNELAEFTAAIREFRRAVVISNILQITAWVVLALMFFFLLPPLLKSTVIEALNYYNSTIQTP